MGSTRAYETTDGQLFKSAKAFKLAQKEIDRRNRLKTVELPFGTSFFEDVNGKDVVYVDDLPALIAKHGDAILAALNVKRTYKTRTAAAV